MGHLVGKEIYHKLGEKIDTLPFRVSKSKALYNILKELYTAEEAELVVRMPHGLTRAGQLEKITGFEKNKLALLLESLSAKGLIVDICVGKRYYYMPSPMVIGIFEFTMMRTGDNLDTRKWAELFHTYINEGEFYAVNLDKGQKVTPMRALPHEGSLHESAYSEVLDYEKATSIIESHKKFAVGICSCRHEKLHVGEKKCDVPLETCATFGESAEFMIRHKFSREVSKTEMLESLTRSKEMGLVFSSDNVRKNVSFICQCCGCCCNLLLGISKFGYPNAIVTSGYIADSNKEACDGCAKCAKACPIGAIEMVLARDNGSPGRKEPVIDKKICIGCGVCALKCTKTGAMKLIAREKRVLHPETTFERVILQCLERGTLQHQIFGEPEKITQKMMKGFVGGFLRLSPVKKALMSDTLRSSFLDAMKKGAAKQKKEFLLER